MIGLFELIVPSFANLQCSKNIRNKIKNKTDLDKPSTKKPLEQLSKDTLEKLYDADKLVKDKIEDKAKTNVVSVTITVTLIMGAYTLLQNILDKLGYGLLYYMAIALFVCAVIYMLAAGIHAVHVLTAENVFHTASMELEGNEYKENLDLQIGLNRARNTLRNNYIFTSYECIRNALICLFAVMMIAIAPMHNNDGNSIPVRHGNYYLSTNAMQSVLDGVDFSVVEAYIETQPKKNEIISAIDEKDQLFIKYSLDDDMVFIYLIEPY